MLRELPLELVTSRMRLRIADVADAEVYFPHVSDPELPRHMTWMAHASIDETRAWLRHTDDALTAGTDVVWAIELDGAVVGTIGLHGICWSVLALRVDRAELGYWIAPHARNRGLMSEAARAVTGWAFATLGLHKVWVQCTEANAGSRRVIEKLGFRFVGAAVDDVWRDGLWHTRLRYELLATEWRA
ncbi:MAG: GNAT family protein [Kofleriaceae bacterium]|nr:GNAT family protein [Kofleriaceae bacterium]